MALSAVAQVSVEPSKSMTDKDPLGTEVELSIVEDMIKVNAEIIEEVKDMASLSESEPLTPLPEQDCPVQPVKTNFNENISVSEQSLSDTRKSSVSVSEDNEELLTKCLALIDVAYDLIGECRAKFRFDSASGNKIKTLAIDTASMCEFVGESLKELEVLSAAIIEAETHKSMTFENLPLDCRVDHDPGKRPFPLKEHQKRYLLTMGPNQPYLAAFPEQKNASIGSRHQKRMNVGWYKKYRYLEYSVSKDRIYCFACMLFPSGPKREKAEDAWVKSGLCSWNKMMSRGAENPGKLKEHFESAAHQSAVIDMAVYSKLEFGIEKMFDEQTKALKRQQEKEAIENRRGVKVLMDIVKTLGKQ